MVKTKVDANKIFPWCKNKTEKSANFSLWIGLEDSAVEGMFRWTDGYLVTWLNWENGQPTGDSYSDENVDDCIVRRSGTLGQWLDKDCREQKNYYCEKIFRKCLISMNVILVFGWTVTVASCLQTHMNSTK